MSELNIANITATKGHVQAVAFARKGGAALSKAFHEIADAKEQERRGPIVMMVTLERIFTDEEAAAIPVVGSKQGETGNKPFDRYTAEITTQDGKKKVPGSWFTDVVKASGEGEAISLRIQQVTDAMQPAGNVDAPEDIRAMNFIQRKQELKRLRERFATMRTALTKGAMLWHQLVAVNSMNPNRVKAQLPVDTEGNVIGNFIRVTDPTDPEQLELLNVGGFLQFDPEKAAKDPDGGTIASLKATAARAPRKTPVTGNAATIPQNVEQVKTLFNVLASGLDNGTDQGKKMEAALLAACAKEGQDGEETVVSVGNVCMACDNIWNVIGDRYRTIMSRRAAAMNTKGKAAA